MSMINFFLRVMLMINYNMNVQLVCLWNVLLNWVKLAWRYTRYGCLRLVGCKPARFAHVRV